MKFIIRRHLDAIAVLEAKGALTKTSAFVALREHCNHLIEAGCRAILIDLKDVRRANLSGIAAMVALVGENLNVHLAFCGLGKHILRKLQSYGLDRGLHIYTTTQEAMKTAEVRRAGLCYTRAVILCNEDPQNLSLLSNVVPTVMLDVFGHPLIRRLMNHLADHGVRDVVANPGHLGEQIFDYFQGAKSPHQALVFANEGIRQGGQSNATPLLTASSLRQIQERQCTFCDDFLVLNGNTFTDADLSALKAHHIKSSADVTVAVSASAAPELISRGPGPGEWCADQILGQGKVPSRDTIAAYVMSPRVLDIVPKHEDWDIWRDLIPALIARNRPISLYRSKCHVSEIRSPNDFANLLIKGLKNQIPGLVAVNPQETGRFAPMPAKRLMSQVTPKSSFVAADAAVDTNVELLGNCVVGAGARIAGPCVLEDCIVLSDTNIAPGFWGKNLILHRDWAFDYRMKPAALASLGRRVGSGFPADAIEDQIRQTA